MHVGTIMGSYRDVGGKLGVVCNTAIVATISSRFDHICPPIGQEQLLRDTGEK
jgi:hypothetical protein